MEVIYYIRMHTKTDKLFWNLKETAHRLSLTEQALRDQLYKGRGPKVTRMGRRVLFRPSDVIAWVDELSKQS